MVTEGSEGRAADEVLGRQGSELECEIPTAGLDDARQQEIGRRSDHEPSPGTERRGTKTESERTKPTICGSSFVPNTNDTSYRAT